MPGKNYHFQRSFFVALFVSAFGLNWAWEMLQMPAYAKTIGNSWQTKTLVCTAASVIDAVITLGVYGLGARLTGRLQRAMSESWKVYLSFAFAGAACAVLIEKVALAFGYWSYSERMPVLPAVGTGLFPFLQLTLLLPLALWIARRLSGKQNNKDDRNTHSIKKN